MYQGLVFEATQLVDQIGADLWVVQKSTRGPFTEVSRIPENLELRLAAVPGVQSAKSFVAHTIQREHRGKPIRMFVQGLHLLHPLDGRPTKNARLRLLHNSSSVF